MTSRKKFTLVVGAGASADLGLPLGWKLKEKISSILNIKFKNGYDLSSGDYTVCEALRLYGGEINNGNRGVNCFLPTAHHISAAMPQAISIDNFIDCAQGFEHVEICGKLAIAKAILDAERGSKLYLDGRNYKESIDFASTEQTWLNPFTRILTENCTKERIAERLADLCIICFNYDRCAEWYFYHWLQNYYRFDQETAANLVRSIDIYHPYGKVGELPNLGSGKPVAFGADTDASTLLSVARQIKTFTEGTDEESSEICELREAVSNSEIVVFLGFAYHELNMSLLSSPMTKHINDSKAFGTAYGLSDSDTDLIQLDIQQAIRTAHKHITLRNDLKCHDLFSEYSRSLRWPKT